MEQTGNGARAGRKRTAALVVVRALVVVAVLISLGASVLIAVNSGHRVGDSSYDLDQQLGEPAFMVAKVVAAVLFAVAAWLLTARRPPALLGFAALAAALADAVGVFAGQWVVLGRVGSHELPAMDAALWLGSWTFAVEPVVVVTMYWLYPQGVRARGRAGVAAALAVVACLVGLAQSVIAPLNPDPAGPFAGLHNPVGISGVPGLDALLGLGLVLGNGVLVVRWLRSGEDERRAFRTLAVVALIGFLLPLLPVPTTTARLLYQVHTLVLLLVVLSAVLRHQLYGIELVLNRTLVYLTLTGLIAGLYAALVALAGLLGWGAHGVGDVPAAVLAALVLLPARDRVQRVVNRLMYGQRDEPFAVVARIASHAETAADPEQLLERLLASIVAELRLPAARVTVTAEDGTSRLVAVGADGPDEERFPLIHQGVTLGELAVTRRSGQSVLDANESRLLAHTATQAAAVGHELLLREQLLRSRERVIGVAEEERRRLRQDLHDGLGPLLTAAASRVDACRGFLGRDDRRVDALLDDIRGDLTEGLGDLRRLVNSLRPVVLDELGLAEAVRQRCDRSSVPTTLHVEGDLPSLPAAVEISAYRIVAEGLTNVSRHSGAHACAVTLRVDGGLIIEIHDDGDGQGAADGSWRPGIGLSSMRERATELGGSFQAGPVDGGGRVCVTLPLALAGVPR